MSCDSLDSSVVLFFFARERLLFRWPAENPFLVDVSASTASVLNIVNAPLSSSNVSNGGGPSLGSGAATGVKPQPKHPLMAPSLHATAPDASNRIEAGPHPDTRACVTAVGLPMREKKKMTKLVMVQSDSGSDLAAISSVIGGKTDSHDGVPAPAAAAAASPSYPSMPMRGSDRGTKLRRPVSIHASGNTASSSAVSPYGSTENLGTLIAPRPRSVVGMSSGGSSWTEPDRVAPAPTPIATCVGIHLNSFLHLLRVPFAGFTTINLNDCTLLVIPLTSAAMPEGRVVPPSTSPPSTTRGEAKHDESSRRPRAATAMLVAAMRHPDTDTGSISRFLQCFMNILYREEQRAQYVSAQIKVMEQLLKEWERGRPGEGAAVTSASAPSVKTSMRSEPSINAYDETEELLKGSMCEKEAATSVAGYARMTKQRSLPKPVAPSGAHVDRFTYLAEQPQATLCATIAHLARVINLWGATMRAPACHLPPYLSSSIVHPFLRPQWPKTTVAHPAPRPPPALSGDIVIKDVLRLPLDFLTGVAQRTQNSSSIHFNPNRYSLCRLNPACALTLSELENEYVEALGRRHARLFPLSTVQACLARLATPWRIGALNRSLERALTKISKQRISPPHARQQQPLPLHPHQRVDRAPLSSTASDGTRGCLPQGSAVERDVHATTTLHGHASTWTENRNFLVFDIVEFLQEQGVILVDREFNLVFTHGDVMPAQLLARQEHKLTRSCLKMRRMGKNASMYGARHWMPLHRPSLQAAGTKTSDRTQEHYVTLPSTYVLSMLRLLWLQSRELCKRTGRDLTGDLSDPLSPRTGTKNLPSPSGLYPATPFTKDASVFSPLSTLPPGLSPPTASTKPFPFTVGSHQFSPHAASPARTEWYNLDVYCAWGSACLLCEALAANPQSWFLPIRVSLPHCHGFYSSQWHAARVLPVEMRFPFLDPSVRVCAQQEAKRWMEKGAKDGDRLLEIPSGAPIHLQQGSDIGARLSLAPEKFGLHATSTSVSRPWFLKPEIYTGPAGIDLMSSFKVFKQMAFAKRTAEFPWMGVNMQGDSSPLLTWIPEGGPTAAGPQSANAPLGPRRESATPEKEKGCLLLSPESISEEARAWLSRFAAVIASRVEYAVELQKQLEGQLAALACTSAASPESSNVATAELLHGSPSSAWRLPKASGKGSSAGSQGSPKWGEFLIEASVPNSLPSLELPGIGGSAVQREPSQACTAVAPAESLPDSTVNARKVTPLMRYRKRRLHDCSAVRPIPLVNLPLLGSGKTDEERVAWEKGVGACAELKLGVGVGGQDERDPPFYAVSSVLRGGNSNLPVGILLLVVVHHLVVFTWGKSEIDVERLVQLLERNLRRLQPLLDNFHYVLELIEAGWDSKSLGRALTAEGEQLTRQADSHMGELTSPAEREGDTIDSTVLPGASVVSECASSSTECSKHTPTLIDYQLLMAIETYDALCLAPILHRYANLVVQPIPTWLLLHTAVNEFSDIFLITGTKGGKYGMPPDTRAL